MISLLLDWNSGIAAPNHYAGIKRVGDSAIGFAIEIALLGQPVLTAHGVMLALPRGAEITRERRN